MRRKMNPTVTLGIGLLLVTLFAAGAFAVELPITLDPLSADDRALLSPLFGTQMNPGPDPDGDIVFFIGKELANVPTDTYELRHVILETDDLDAFTLEFKARGGADGSGNPSHFIVFGWQDHKNYYYTYPAESPETRVARVVDGKHETLYRHGANIWQRDRQNYQSIRVTLHEVDGKTVVDTYVNGELAMAYTFAPDKTPPAGKIGISMWNNSLHNAYYKDITLNTP